MLKEADLNQETKDKMHIVADVGQTCGRGKVTMFGDLPAVAASSRWFSYKLGRQGN